MQATPAPATARLRAGNKVRVRRRYPITIAIIGKSLSMVGIGSFWQQALKGAIILLAVIVNVLVQRGIDRRSLEGREI